MTEHEIIEQLAKTMLDLSDRIKEVSEACEFQSRLLVKLIDRVKNLEEKVKGGESS